MPSAAVGLTVARATVTAAQGAHVTSDEGATLAAVAAAMMAEA